MPVALLDTNAVSDLMRDDPQVKSRLAKHADSVLTSVIVLGEIRHGLNRLPAGKKRTDLEARAFAIFKVMKIETVSLPVAEQYGALKADLESQGLNLDDNDLWIVATAMTQGFLLVSRDQIFGKIPGLQVEDWSV